MIVDTSTDNAKTLAKFEQFHNTPYTQGDLVPGNPWKYREYPKMLWKAHECPLMNNKMAISVEMPRRALFEGGVKGDDQHNLAKDEAQRFNDKCQMVVKSPEEESNFRNQGWRGNPIEAMEFFHARELSIAEQTAKGNYEDRNMSEKALAEKEQFESENFGHQPEVIEKPTVKNYDNPGRSNVAKKEHWKTRQAREKKAAQSAA